MRGRTLGTVVLLSASLPAFGISQCSVREEQRWRTLTADFVVGSTSASVTLPRILFQADLVRVFVEVSGGLSGDLENVLFVETGAEKSILKNGVTLHLIPKMGERIALTLSDSTGERLCAWQPAIKIRAHSPPHIDDGFRTFCCGFRVFYNTGDPLLLEVGGKLASGSGEFRVDGITAVILARTSWQVILRDPQPAAGLRTVKSDAYWITIPFVDVQLQLRATSSRPHDTLEIRVVAPQMAKAPVKLWVFNFDKASMSLPCGKSFPRDAEWNEEVRLISLKHDQNGEYTATCNAKVYQRGTVSFDVKLLEGIPFDSRALLPPALRRSR
jgi:hypothetical protein